MRYDRQYKVFSMKKHFIVEGNGFMNLGSYLQNIYNRKKNQTFKPTVIKEYGPPKWAGIQGWGGSSMAPNSIRRIVAEP